MTGSRGGRRIGGILLAFAAAALAGGAGADPLTDKIERERKTLEQLKEKLERQEEQVQQTEKRRETVLHSLQSLDQKLVASRQDRHKIERELRKQDRELEAITLRRDEMRDRIRSRRGAIAARLRVQYMEGRFGYLKALLAAESPADLQRRFRYLAAISEREYDLVESYKKDLERLQAMERQQTEARDQMLALKRMTDRKVREISGLKREKRVFLARITREKEAYEAAIADLKRAESRKESLLRELEERQKAAAARVPKPGPGYKGFKGSLPWPASGEVVSYFGRQKHPNFDTYVHRKGIEIRTAQGSPIRAVMDGTVAYADWLKGYGLVLIVDHQNGFFSLYAHASKILTEVGAKVHAGHVIGETGDTGMTGEDTLYFELRDGADPVDPLLWLAKRP